MRCLVICNLRTSARRKVCSISLLLSLNILEIIDVTLMPEARQTCGYNDGVAIRVA
jgi:hypothetical protein